MSRCADKNLRMVCRNSTSGQGCWRYRTVNRQEGLQGSLGSGTGCSEVLNGPCNLSAAGWIRNEKCLCGDTRKWWVWKWVFTKTQGLAGVWGSFLILMCGTASELSYHHCDRWYLSMNLWTLQLERLIRSWEGDGGCHRSAWISLSLQSVPLASTFRLSLVVCVHVPVCSSLFFPYMFPWLVTISIFNRALSPVDYG